jgi:hypothetical protein
MKRRFLLVALAVVVMAGVAILAEGKKKSLLVLDWAAKAKMETPPVSVLIEMGLKDDKPTSWSGKASVAGAKVVKREGYRFRKEDKLIEPDGWVASSHHGLRVPPGNPGVLKAEGIAPVGVVLLLADAGADATLTIEPEDRDLPKAGVKLADVLAGKPVALWDGRAHVRRVSTATPLVTGKTENDFPAAAYGPDGTLWLAYISYTLKDESRRIEQQPLKHQPADFKAYYTPQFGDQLFVKYLRDGKWSEPLAVTEANQDLVRCAIAVEGNGDAWVVYSADREGNFDIYTRPISKRFNPQESANPAPKIGPEQRLTTQPGPDLGPVLTTLENGDLLLAYQSWSEKAPALIKGTYCHEGKWTAAPVSETSGTLTGNAWHPAVASGPSNSHAVFYDIYEAGDFDVWSTEIHEKGITDRHVAKSPRFEARPVAVYDAEGRLWIAYEEGPEKWGKDYGALEPDRGNPLYNHRSVNVVCVVDGKLRRPVAALPVSEDAKARIPYLDGGASAKYETSRRYTCPKLGLDGKGRLWLTYRVKFGTRYTSHPGSYWLTYARRLDGDHWSAPIEVLHSDGLLDSRPVMLPHSSGGLLVIHNTDGRYTTPEVIHNQIYASVVDLPGDPIEPKLGPPQETGTKDGTQGNEERADIKRIRNYRMEVGGKKYQFLRGEFHRHTEVSWDGGPDGSLEDMFRYAIDAAGLDWIGNADHDNGAGREYPWWLTQKLTAAYTVAKHFTPVYSYERSVNYPHGHRNCVFAKRGVRTLPRLAEEDMDQRVGGVHADDTKMLYRYLKEMDGICASHTSATGMGTDWRDHDDALEPVVEIYQGDRMSYEKEDAPRAGFDPKSNKLPANIGGWYPKGFINLALEKGYKFGFESSSDHWSTHISYSIVLAEEQSREGIVAALGKRHCYAATDNIIVDVRSGNHIMGDAFKTDATPALQLNVIGTKDLARIDILKDSEVVETIKPGKREYKGEWKDPKPAAGEHYYYVRVLQTDDAIAWGSPMWVDYQAK